jgi:hypothetical protein
MKRYILGVLFPVLAWADQPASQPITPEEEGAPRHYGNLRIGASSATQNGRPELCLDVAPLPFLSIEGCGTGAGFLHQDPQPELAHFRAKWKLADIEAGKLWVQPQLMAGFAEMQVREDVPGFQFRGVSESGSATAGAEVGASVRTLMPSKNGVEFVTEMSAAAAWLPHAEQLIIPQSKVQPSFTISFGVGF